MQPLLFLLILAGTLLTRPVSAQSQSAPPRLSASVPLVMAHYMPWFEADPARGQWGWHWTMNHFHPGARTSGRREAASHYTPLMGLYDSGDPDVLECHVLLMKFTGIGGVFVDWYGTDDFLDYGVIQHNILKLVPVLKKAGLKFAIVYEDAAVPKLILAGRVPQTEAVAHGQALVRWMQAHWFTDPAYLHQQGQPVLLTFGAGYYNSAQWSQIFSVLPSAPVFYTEADRRDPAIGAFDWPQPGLGTAGSLQEAARFDAASPLCIPAAYPRFHDIYAAAGVQPSWGRIDDRAGRTYEQTLQDALTSGASVIQLVTWNDWGEGTQIEPSREFGFRDLEATQRLCRTRCPSFPYTAQDLRLPLTLYALKKKYALDTAVQAQLNQIAALLFANRLPEARRRLMTLQTLRPVPGTMPPAARRPRVGKETP